MRCSREVVGRNLFGGPVVQYMIPQVVLVVNTNLDVLLRWGDHMVLSLALQSGKLVHGLVDDIQCLLDLLLGDHQWWSQADDVLVSRLGLLEILS